MTEDKLEGDIESIGGTVGGVDTEIMSPSLDCSSDGKFRCGRQQ